MVSRVAMVQMVSSDNIKDNLRVLESFFLEAQQKSAQLLVLPENFAFMGMKERDKLLVAEEFGNGPIQDAVSQLAMRHQLWVIAGSIPIKHSHDHVTASCMVYDNHGKNVARYDKIHLFDVQVSAEESYQESLTIARGDKLVVVDSPIGCIGLSICYDVRFPELYRQLVLKGAEILTIPSAFTAATGMAHWQILLRARAIENLCYVIAPNQGGMHANGRHTYGHSMMIEPWGNVLCELHDGKGIIFADIDIQRLRQMRSQFPCHDHHVLSR